jgi:uncharacterized repeat protein (TIGR01451 family)
MRRLARNRAWLHRSRFLRRSGEGRDRLERELHALRSEPPTAFVTSLARRVEPEARWVRPRVRFVLVAVLGAVVLAAGASANVLTVAKSAATRTIHLAEHLSGPAKVHRATVPRQTAAQAQYAVLRFVITSRIRGAGVAVNGQGVASARVGTKVHDTVTVRSVPSGPLAGSVIFRRYSTFDCSGTSVTQTVPLPKGATSPETVSSSVVTVVGDMCYRFDFKSDEPDSAGNTLIRGRAEPLRTPAAPPPRKEHPAIEITKTPDSQTVTKSDPASWTITVTNTGDVKLHDVTVTDAKAPNCSHSLGILNPGQSKTYTCSRPNTTENYTNVAVAVGTSPKKKKVTDNDSAHVKAAPLKPAEHPKPPPPPPPPPTISHEKPKTTG